MPLPRRPCGCAIDHNIYFRNSAGAIQFDGGSGQGPGATNLSFTDNVVTEPGQWAEQYGAISMVAPTAAGSIIAEPVFDKIKIENNLIEKTPGPAIIVTSASNFSIGPNQIIDSNQTQTSPTTYGTLSTLDSILVDKSSDGTVCEGHRKDGTTGLTGIDPTDHKVLVDYACDWNHVW